jgi:hypothetical protein
MTHLVQRAEGTTMNRREFLALGTAAVDASALEGCARQTPLDISGDSAVCDAPTSDQISAFGDQWFGTGRVAIAHANHPGVIGAMQHLVDLVAQRGLRTVTLLDVFAT